MYLLIYLCKKDGPGLYSQTQIATKTTQETRKKHPPPHKDSTSAGRNATRILQGMYNYSTTPQQGTPKHSQGFYHEGKNATRILQGKHNCNKGLYKKCEKQPRSLQAKQHVPELQQKKTKLRTAANIAMSNQLEQPTKCCLKAYSQYRFGVCPT